MFDSVLGNFCRKRGSFRGVLSRILILALLCAVLATFPNTAWAQQGSFAFTGSPIGGPAGGGPPVRLNNGMVLIGLQLYNPATGTFTATAGSTDNGGGTTATLLQNGMVLIAVQNNVHAELYDPTTGTFANTGNMITARAAATATLLHNGTVLIAGGAYSCGIGTSCPPPTAELYDPTVGTFSPTGPPFYAHSAGTATLLNNGMVLLTGGGPQGPNETLDPVISQATELYDPSKGSFSGTPVTGLNTGRGAHTATLLNNGQVLIVGGNDINGHPLASAELFDPTTGAFTFTGSMGTARVLHTATLLNNGQVLIVGGLDSNNNNLASAELYDPTTGTFTPTGSMNTAGEAGSATLLNNGTVLVTGGLRDIDSAELYELVGFAPASVSFPNQIINVKSGSQNLTLTNSLSTALSITGITIGGTNASDFAETNNCPGSVSAGASCSISVTFTPAAAGSRTGSLIIANTLPATDGPLQVLLSGTGIVPAPIVSLSTNGVDFATQAIGTTSVPQTVTLRNTGNASLSIQTVAVTGAGDFAITSGSTCTNGSSVAISGSCTIQVTFTPTGNGERSAAIGITDNAADSPEMISLSGSGPPPPPPSGVASLSPRTVSFSAQYVGTSGLPQTVTVTNTGNATLTITGVAASPADFGVLSNCSNPVAVNSSCTIGVFFDPTVGGTRTGTLTITDNAGNSPQTVMLTGSGSDFSMAPSSAASATVTAGQTANYSIAVAPAGGFAQSVALSCSGGPAGSSCSVSPNTIALSGAAAKTAMVTVTTAGSQGWVLPFAGGWPGRYRLMPLILSLAGMLVLMVVALVLGRREQPFGWARVFALALLGCLAMTLTSCGGGSGGGGTNPGAGTYTVTVAGNFTSGSTTLSHATQVTLVVH